MIVCGCICLNFVLRVQPVQPCSNFQTGSVPEVALHGGRGADKKNSISPILNRTWHAGDWNLERWKVRNLE